MSRALVLAALLATMLAGCSGSRPAATTAPTGCPEPTRLTGLPPFDDENRATWRKELAAGGACDAVTAAYVTRLEDKKAEQLFANASTFAMIGRVTDATSGAPVEQVCVTPGKPGSICWGRTDRDGWYLLDLGSVAATEGFFEIFFTKNGYPEQHTINRRLSGRGRIDYQMTK